MREQQSAHFGLLIAYVVPGFVTLWGASFVVDSLGLWLRGPSHEGPTVAGFLHVTIASITAGMLMNALRWAIVDTAHHAAGIVRPRWSFARLHERLQAYEWLVENHYRHYQFYGNTLCGLIFGYGCWRASLPEPGSGFGWIDIAVVALCLVLVVGSRSTLCRYYARVESLLAEEWKESRDMANGGHPKPKTESRGTGTGKPGHGTKQPKTDRPQSKSAVKNSERS